MKKAKPATRPQGRPAEAVLTGGWESMEVVAGSETMRAELEALAFLERSCEVAGEPIEPPLPAGHGSRDES